jgi:hypothetical protein
MGLLTWTRKSTIKSELDGLRKKRDIALFDLRIQRFYGTSMKF